MGKYIHLFETNAEFQAMYNDAEKYIEPWTSYTKENGGGCNYNKSESEKLLGTPLTFKITSDGVIKFKKPSRFAPTVTLQYKKNDEDWASFTSSTAVTSINVVAGDKVIFRGNNAAIGGASSSNSFSGTTAGFTLEGNIMSLVNSENFANLTTLETANTFSYLFRSCTRLSDASKLVLPATASTTNCYLCMFYDCSGLVTAPELPATTLATQCYQSMFDGCSNLTAAPELPATDLTQSCYYSMFARCASLATSPVLPATTLATQCYQSMFDGCTSLNYIKAMFTTTPDTSYTTNWVNGVASTGTFVKNSAAAWDVTGVHGVPTGWTVETATQ